MGLKSCDGAVKRTSLFDCHRTLGARMLPFSGWEMPIQYTSILEEAMTVRSSTGIFDVSHMGRLEIQGPDAEDVLDRILSFDVSGMLVGTGRYGVICNVEGGIIDDCITYRLHDDMFILVPNAANTGVVLEWIVRWSRGANLEITDMTLVMAMVALQGPDSQLLLERLANQNFSELRPFSIVCTQLMASDVFIARTGYTGEDGFEIILSQEIATRVWEFLTDNGAAPCGLGARDVLRLEAGLMLYGNDIDVSINPYEARLEKFVDPDRDGYIAGQSLRRIRDRGVSRQLVGFFMLGRGIARKGYPIMVDDKEIGIVTSGGVSRTLDRNIGLGYVPSDFAVSGSRFHVDVRGRIVEAEVTMLPFYSFRRNR